MTSSNTIVRNGMPFIGKVLEQVAPYMDKMLVTISEKSSDGTVKEVQRVWEQYPDKILVDFENVAIISELTGIRNRQLENTETEWTLILDDDDWWPREELKKCLEKLDDLSVLAYSVSPFQLIDNRHYDAAWFNKYFSKFLRTKDVRFINPWPQDLPADKEGRFLDKRVDIRNRVLPYRFFHLSRLKYASFRKEEWAVRWRKDIERIGNLQKLDREFVP